MLLKLYIYGYLNRVQSSRRLEREAGRNVEVMWLTGRLVPDHKTIADFRKDNGRAMVVLLLLGINVLSRSDQWWFIYPGVVLTAIALAICPEGLTWLAAKVRR